MDLISCVEVWVQSLRLVFEKSGISVHFSRTSDSRPKHSATLNLRRGAVEVDLVVWDSREAEPSTVDDVGVVHQQYFEDLATVEDLARVLSRVAVLMRLTVESP